jgi:transcriptional regulator with XRE-family HTH domain
MNIRDSLMSAKRRPGDPIPGTLIKELRDKHGLTQAALAEMLGVKGGKTVISGWEHSACEGPAAELILYLLGGADSDVAVARLEAAMDKVWTRAEGEPEHEWRQVIFSASGAPRIEMQEFVGLFPQLGLALQAPAATNGFPFQAVGTLPHDVVSLTPHAWQGCIPTNPHYRTLQAWLFTDEAQFCVRDVRRRDPDTNPLGLIDVGMQLQRAVQATYFVRNVASRLKLDADLRCTLRMDLEGVAGRTIIDTRGDTEFQLSSETARWAESHASSRLDLSLGDIVNDPRETALRLVSELAGQVSVTLANTKALGAVIDRPEWRQILPYLDVDRAHRARKGGK